ncbi:MAG: 1-(5-phosphoribosyl)-5-[(5-phosphoribosylamino)methylideneamino]imidazole-4-carboxamide isomerase [Gemmatales bacterium]|nr:1-(5-phosphoribosyl)-5-[(5-phosphoribosylamino)methylideneamino]imidazole-4-carboxamide isomerase [Gemmatales bacterium]MDW7994669.1 1-(5-phosphoribosyl)-5-[(5-phosphoribosylamino)methylideneamino]imidazole-4-carboxamide isomerase [Gemmatales bacterium]
MLIIPALDLRSGRCVRLRQGDFDTETVYGDDPVALAEYWVRLGAARLHLVDLDGARLGQPQQLDIVQRIVERTAVPCQLGGGLRSEFDLRAAFNCGVTWAVIGTQAFLAPEWFREMCHKFPHRLWLGVDVRDGFVATHGWQKTTELDPAEVVSHFSAWPIAGFIVTDISRDGTLCGVRAHWLGQLAQGTTLPVIASGGIATLDDLRQLRAAGLAGCIIGKALYEGRFDLRAAMQAVSS